jgi:hypothetical protein
MKKKLTVALIPPTILALGLELEYPHWPKLFAVTEEIKVNKKIIIFFSRIFYFAFDIAFLIKKHILF